MIYREKCLFDCQTSIKEIEKISCINDILYLLSPYRSVSEYEF